MRQRLTVRMALPAIALSGLLSFIPKIARAQDPLDPAVGLSSLVFDVSYYKKVNPDLASLSDAAAQTNWLNSGASQGRRAHPLFWNEQYLAYYPDLTAAFGAANYSQ